MVSAKSDLEREKRENQRLKNELTRVKSDEFIEAEARNKLFLVKPGESGVIIPSNLTAKRPIAPAPEPPNWQKWLNLFIKGN